MSGNKPTNKDPIIRIELTKERLIYLIIIILCIVIVSLLSINSYLADEVCQRVCGVCNGGSMTSIDLLGGRTGYGCQCWNETGCTVIE